MCDCLDEPGTAVTAASGDGWGDYLAAFHDERPGVTEDVLADALADDGSDPYDWLAAALPSDRVIVDVACGSGPLARRVGSRWTGLDRSPAELARAAAIAPGRVVLADAAGAPLRAGAADAVACSMALMLLDDPGAALAEMARLLRDGGRFAALIPATVPLTRRDRLRYVRLLAALRLRRLPFPHPDLLTDPRPLLAPAGLTLVSADRRRFAYPLTEPSDAQLWVRSLYLPGLDHQRLDAAQRITRRWTGSSIGIPLWRLVATTNP
ncbi:MAG: class I SAM-dependent methyltransferase [Acidimicrobiales bacterium]